MLHTAVILHCTVVCQSGLQEPRKERGAKFFFLPSWRFTSSIFFFLQNQGAGGYGDTKLKQSGFILLLQSQGWKGAHFTVVVLHCTVVCRSRLQGPRKERGAKFLFFRRHGDLRRDRSFRLLFELDAKDKQGDHLLFNTSKEFPSFNDGHSKRRFTVASLLVEE